MDTEDGTQVRTEETPFTAGQAAQRCLASVVGFHDAGETAEAAAGMSEDIRAVVARCGDRGMPPFEFVRSVLYPPRKALAERYGRVCGGRLFAAFLTAFLTTPNDAPPTRGRRFRFPS